MIPSQIFDQHVVALGKTRSGKSYALRGLAERLLDEGKRVCIVDPKGDWWGLKSSATGKSAGYPVVIFGGEHGDVPLNSHVGGQVSELVATGNRPCILDFGGWTVGDRTRFWIDFAAGLFKHNKGKIWLLIDEVHNFAPKGKIMDPDAGKCLHWTNRLASEGAGKGILLIIASQRPAKVHNDTLTSCETLIAKRVIHPSDREAISEWIDGCGDPSQAGEVLKTIATIERTDGWVWSPEIGFGPKLVTFPKIKTFDSFAGPTGDSGKETPKGWAEVNLDEVKQKLAAVVEQAKANDPGELKKELARVKRELESRPKEKPEIVQVPLLTPKDAKEIEEILNTIETLAEMVHNLKAEIQPLKNALLGKLQAQNRSQAVAVKPVARPSRQPVRIESDGSLSKCERAILTALAQYPQGRTSSQVAILTGYSGNSGGFNNSLSKLRSSEFITRGIPIQITESGLGALGNWTPLPTGRELADHWLRQLGKCEALILQTLMEVYPDGLSSDELGQRTGYSVNSGGFNNSLSRLRTLELINRGQPITATSEFFQ